MEKLQLEKCEISDDAALGLAQCTRNIQRLVLDYCKLTAIGWKTVFGGVTNMTEKVISVMFLFMLKYVPSVS